MGYAKKGEKIQLSELAEQLSWIQASAATASLKAHEAGGTFNEKALEFDKQSAESFFKICSEAMSRSGFRPAGSKKAWVAFDEAYGGTLGFAAESASIESEISSWSSAIDRLAQTEAADAERLPQVSSRSPFLLKLLGNPFENKRLRGDCGKEFFS